MTDKRFETRKHRRPTTTRSRRGSRRRDHYGGVVIDYRAMANAVAASAPNAPVSVYELYRSAANSAVPTVADPWLKNRFCKSVFHHFVRGLE